MVKVRMRQTVLLGPSRQRLERDQEYDVSMSSAEQLVPRYAVYVEEPLVLPDGADTDLSMLTVAQLKELAAERGVDLTATKKADIIAQIEQALSDKNGE